MGLLTRHLSRQPDTRPRDYVLTGCPLVAQDDHLVLVDATVRLTPREPTDETAFVLGYDPAQEAAMHAVFVVVLRLMAVTVPADELLVSRARVSEALEQGFAFAPVGAGVDARVQSVELHPHAADRARFNHEFRLVSP